MARRRKARELALQFLYQLDQSGDSEPGPHEAEFWAPEMDRLLRLKVLPLAIGPPFGLTVLDLPGRIPLPSKITIRVLDPIDLRAHLDPDPDPHEGYRLVTDAMQDSLSALSRKRRFPVIG